ncbi:MAG: hypothetical protein HKM03_04695 [Steroidobacteraceae bacterium]|nr:hypothetical protein [Steroidobacteraceae bacterium]
MEDKNPSPFSAFPRPPVDEPSMDFRARMLSRQAEAAARRQLGLAEQCSTRNSAEERIRIWERLHEITLPRDMAHRLIEVIAADTGLSGEAVREEQSRRAATKNPA